MSHSNEVESSGDRAAVKINTIAGYLGLLNSFSGSEPSYPAEYFLQSIEEIGRIAEWADTEKLIVLKAKLKGRAAEFLANSPELREERNYERFKTEFLRHFKNEFPLTYHLQNFTGCRQKPNESVKDFASRVKNAAFGFLQGANFNSPDVERLADRTKLSQFLAGLNPKIQKHVLNHDPQDLATAIKFAALVEGNEGISRNYGTVNAIERQATGNSFELNTLQSMLAEVAKESMLQRTSMEKLAQELREVKEGNVLARRGRGVPPQMSTTPLPAQRNMQRFEVPPRFSGRGFQPRGNLACFGCGSTTHLLRNCFRRGNPRQQQDFRRGQVSSNNWGTRGETGFCKQQVFRPRK